jgi:hypothetical protein
MDGAVLVERLIVTQLIKFPAFFFMFARACTIWILNCITVVWFAGNS